MYTQGGIRKLTAERLENRVQYVENLILKSKDWKDLPYLNNTLQKLMDEQVRRDLNETNKRPT